MSECHHKHLSLTLLPGDGVRFCLDCEKWVAERDIPDDVQFKEWLSYWKFAGNTPWLDGVREKRVRFVNGKPIMDPRPDGTGGGPNHGWTYP